MERQMERARRARVWTGLVGVLMAAAPTAVAQDGETPEARREERYLERTVIDDWDEVEVSASLVKPEGVIDVGYRRPAFNPMIRLRTTFGVELSESVDEVK